MNRAEFMFELGKLLADVPYEERCEALSYYENYFEDAGVDKEAQVIEELGSPREVAATIKADFGVNIDDNSFVKAEEAKEFSEFGFTDERFGQREVPMEMQDKKPWSSSGLKIALIICIIVFAFPIIAGVAAAVFGLIAGLVGLIIGLVATAFSLVVAGIAVFIGAFFVIVPSGGGAALLMIGASLILLALGILAVWGTCKLLKLVFVKVFPAFFKLIGKIFRRMLGKKEVVR